MAQSYGNGFDIYTYPSNCGVSRWYLKSIKLIFRNSQLAKDKRLPLNLWKFTESRWQLSPKGILEQITKISSHMSFQEARSSCDFLQSFGKDEVFTVPRGLSYV